MTLTERERQAVENGNARGCIMCRRIVEAWSQAASITKERTIMWAALNVWRDEALTFDVSAQKFHVEGEVRTENHRAMEGTK